MMHKRLIVPNDLHAAIKAEARARGMKLAPFAAQLLTAALARVEAVRRRKRAG